MECLYCKSEFQPKNKKGKYCSPRCRTYAGRGKDKIATVEEPKPKEVVAILESVPEEEGDVFFYLEEYERVYLAKKAPSFLDQRKWDALRKSKLEELANKIKNQQQ